MNSIDTSSLGTTTGVTGKEVPPGRKLSMSPNTNEVILTGLTGEVVPVESGSELMGSDKAAGSILTFDRVHDGRKVSIDIGSDKNILTMLTGARVPRYRLSSVIIGSESNIMAEMSGYIRPHGIDPSGGSMSFHNLKTEESLDKVPHDINSEIAPSVRDYVASTNIDMPFKHNTIATAFVRTTLKHVNGYFKVAREWRNGRSFALAGKASKNAETLYDFINTIHEFGDITLSEGTSAESDHLYLALTRNHEMSTKEESGEHSMVIFRDGDAPDELTDG